MNTKGFWLIGLIIVLAACNSPKEVLPTQATTNPSAAANREVTDQEVEKYIKAEIKGKERDEVKKVLKRELPKFTDEEKLAGVEVYVYGSDPSKPNEVFVNDPALKRKARTARLEKLNSYSYRDIDTGEISISTQPDIPAKSPDVTAQATFICPGVNNTGPYARYTRQLPNSAGTFSMSSRVAIEPLPISGTNIQFNQLVETPYAYMGDTVLDSPGGATIRTIDAGLQYNKPSTTYIYANWNLFTDGAVGRVNGANRYQASKPVFLTYNRAVYFTLFPIGTIPSFSNYVQGGITASGTQVGTNSIVMETRYNYVLYSGTFYFKHIVSIAQIPGPLIYGARFNRAKFTANTFSFGPPYPSLNLCVYPNDTKVFTSLYTPVGAPEDEYTQIDIRTP
jgi:hypothetical protein